MKVDRYTTLHRKDERGVIVDSRVFGPDDEIPEGFGEGDYSPVNPPREDTQEPVAESKLTPWTSPIGKGTWVENRSEEDETDEGSPLQAREDLTGAEQEALADVESDEESEGDGSEDETDEGSPREARDELTDAEEEADESLEDSDDEAPATEDETDAGTPVQAQDSEDSVEVPPQGGPGSGREAWSQYAASQGVSVPEGASRDEIIAAVKAAGKPVD